MVVGDTEYDMERCKGFLDQVVMFAFGAHACLLLTGGKGYAVL